MNIDAPRSQQIPALRRLWGQAFGDTEEFLDAFFETAYSPRRCRCLTEDGQIAAALYWFSGECRGAKVAYLYAVATAEALRGRGYCHALMADTHRHLAALGYQGAVLVPGSGALFRLYRSMGYEVCAGVEEFLCGPGPEPAALHPIDTAAYARLRREMLPEGGVIQEGENLAFLEAQAKLYAGPNLLLATQREGDSLRGLELLGDASAAPGILRALGAAKGSFRIPGQGRPFAMYRPLTEPPCPPPAYFGLAFD